jgi:hypothetical protein
VRTTSPPMAISNGIISDQHAYVDSTRQSTSIATLRSTDSSGTWNVDFTNDGYQISLSFPSTAGNEANDSDIPYREMFDQLNRDPALLFTLYQTRSVVDFLPVSYEPLKILDLAQFGRAQALRQGTAPIDPSKSQY